MERRWRARRRGGGVRRRDPTRCRRWLQVLGMDGQPDAEAHRVALGQLHRQARSTRCNLIECAGYRSGQSALPGIIRRSAQQCPAAAGSATGCNQTSRCSRSGSGAARAREPIAARRIGGQPRRHSPRLRAETCEVPCLRPVPARPQRDDPSLSERQHKEVAVVGLPHSLPSNTVHPAGGSRGTSGRWRARVRRCRPGRCAGRGARA